MARVFVQGMDYFLAGSGCTLTATSITVTNLTFPDGETPIVTADIGDICYATLEPETSREENISFTGITQNANGTATLTGVTRGLKFKAPYDADNTLRFSHAGAALIRISNSAPFYDVFATKFNDETLDGLKTFLELPTIPAVPLAATDAASKAYVDASVIAVGGITDGYVTKNGADPTLTINVGAGKFIFGSSFVTFAGAAATAVTPSATNYVQLKRDGTLTINTTGFLGGYIPLATVTADGSTITVISDQRAFFTQPEPVQEITASFTYGATIVAGNPLYLDVADGKWKLALATSAATADSLFGIALDAGSNNDTGKRVQIGGAVTGVLSGLTPGFQYLTDVGGLATTPDTYRKMVGFAPTATTLILFPGIRIEDISGGDASATTANLNTALDFADNLTVTGSDAAVEVNNLASSGGTEQLAHGYHVSLMTPEPIRGGVATGCGYSYEGADIISFGAYDTAAGGGQMYGKWLVAIDYGTDIYLADNSSNASNVAAANTLFADGFYWTAAPAGGTTAYKNGSLVTFDSNDCSGAIGWDDGNSYLLFNNTTTNVRRFTYSGTNLTFVDNITLSNAVTVDMGFVFDDVNNMFYFIDTTNNVVRKFNISGTQQSTTAYTIDDAKVKGLVAIRGRIYIAVSEGSSGSDNGGGTDNSSVAMGFIPTTISL